MLFLPNTYTNLFLSGGFAKDKAISGWPLSHKYSIKKKKRAIFCLVSIELVNDLFCLIVQRKGPLASWLYQEIKPFELFNPRFQPLERERGGYLPIPSALITDSFCLNRKCWQFNGALRFHKQRTDTQRITHWCIFN